MTVTHVGVRGAGVLVLLLLASAAGAAQAAQPPSDPWQRYRDYLGATRGGDVRPYLTDEGRAQFDAFSPEAQAAARGLLYSLPGLHDATLVKKKVEGQRARIDAIVHFASTPGSEQKDAVEARVEMVLTGQGWAVVSETFTPTVFQDTYGRSLRDAGWTSEDGKSWTSLRAPGVFPPSVQARADAELRDRASGDGWAIADVRTVIAAEAAYQSANGGYYDRLECLYKADQCIPGYPSIGPHFLEGATASARNGYRPRFDPGPAAPQSATTSRSSVTSYAFWMIPDEGRPGRTLCGDHSGIVCTIEGRTPAATKGECPVEPAGPCRPLH